ncbi:hypothetical protein N7474_002571 [Penicillium riverlandense]|uniref:uncharacterized protein n=1 Tax=Penicillium riverlandense TaxID=1903569 RepID=UPI002548AA90|nr:uncharacterized protein N7474_002571 [Penicillium riverlandense]KAJ5825433.1 hypothetical protein N7474_002571 [Penicillium riverlandense]
MNVSRRFAKSFATQATATGVRILEVGCRDGLQNVATYLPVPAKVELFRRLIDAGLRDIEATSFVSPKWVPQLRDSTEVMEALKPDIDMNKLRSPVLTPNMRGVQRAIESGAHEISLFASATEEFSRKNQNCSMQEGLAQAEKLAAFGLEQGLAVRGMVSCIFVDPYTGPTDTAKVVEVTNRLLEMGCHEVGLADTTGVGTPRDTQRVLEAVLRHVPANRLALHFHDTFGQALANVSRSYELGIRAFDSSIAGLGGCPYAKGARGNLATEDLVYMFENSGINTGVDLVKLSTVGEWISKQLCIPNGSRAGAAVLAKRPTAKCSSFLPPSKHHHLPPATSPSARKWEVILQTEEFTACQSGSTVRITLMRPDKGNTLTEKMVDGLTSFIEGLKNDPTIFHLILTAQGRFFCTGLDLKGDTQPQDTDSDRYYSKAKALLEAIEQAPQTTIALINGPSYGGGVGLGFACDIRLVSPEASWTLSEIKLGLSPAIISKYLVREWGPAFFREATITGRKVSAPELHRIGTVHGISDSPETLEVLLEQYLDRLTYCAPKSASTCKQLVRVGWMDAGGPKQEAMIRETFDNMMTPNSEGQFGIQQFRKKVRNVDWREYWSSRITNVEI